MKSAFLLNVALAVALCGISVQCLEVVEPFSVKISTKSEYGVGEPVECQVTITNHLHGDKTLYLLERNTPLEGINADIFSVTLTGDAGVVKVRYDGILLKRLPPSSDEAYVRIGAKSSLTYTVDLSPAYSFAAAGSYRVQLHTTLQFFESTGNLSVAAQQVLSNARNFTLSKTQNRPLLTSGEKARRNNTTQFNFDQTLSPHPSLRADALRTPKFAGSGTSSDVSTANTAYTYAYNTLYPSYQSVTGKPSLYKTWFGVAYSAYMTTVKGVYLNIRSAMESYQFTLYFHGSKCKPGVVAYTHHGDTTLYFCDGYFSARTTGTDSKMGTIVHEMSHAVAYTEDVMYGQSGCQQLAITNPDQAIKNADNYEYFAESQ